MPKLVLATLALGIGLIAAPAAVVSAESAVQPKIVNGVRTSDWPSVGALLGRGESRCSGTMIGCQTMLTAAHCVFGVAPSDLTVYLQHEGLFGVTFLVIHPLYDGFNNDVALLKLDRSIESTAPARIDRSTASLLFHTGTLVGFGNTSGRTPDAGLKRKGLVVTSPCDFPELSDRTSVCWDFLKPLDEAGFDSNTCFGDSGGPLFLDRGLGPVLAGVTNGGTLDCKPPNHAWDLKVGAYQEWIRSEGGPDVRAEARRCNAAPQLDDPMATLHSWEGKLSAEDKRDYFSFSVPVQTRQLTVTLNGREGDAADFDLYLRRGSRPTLGVFDCASTRDSQYEACRQLSPEPGTWHVLVRRFKGKGRYQLTISSSPHSPMGCE